MRSACQVAADIREGRATAEVVGDCLKRVAEVDGEVQAWAFLDRDYAYAAGGGPTSSAGPSAGPAAWSADRHQGRVRHRRHAHRIGLAAVGGRTPRRDAAAVARLRAAGAVIMGKTVTTEYAYYHPGKTRNPHDPGRTSGGSSSGSAAAVAAAMVPGAIGSQTNGSVIRPAAFCGVVGFKPTHGLISRAGALMLSRTLDHVGMFARSVEDVALLAETLVGFDEEDPTRGLSHAPVRGRGWKRAAVAAALRLRAVAGLEARRAGDAGGLRRAGRGAGRAGRREAELPDNAIDRHRTIMEVEMAHNLHRDYEQGRDQFSAPLRQLIERGRGRNAVEYTQAVAAIGPLNEVLAGVFDEYDAILTPAAPGRRRAGSRAPATRFSARSGRISARPR